MSSSRSASLATSILEKLKGFEDDELEAGKEATPEPAAPFTKRACAERLRSYATHRWLPQGGLTPPEYAVRGLRCVGDAKVECAQCGSRGADVADADACNAVHAPLCAWRDAPLDASVWEDTAACRAERGRGLLERLDAFAARGPKETAAAESLAAKGWSVLEGSVNSVHCSLCDRTLKLASVDSLEAVAHRCWCPRAVYESDEPERKRART